MFDKLVMSTTERRKGRTARFFACTSIVYLSVAAIAFAASVYFSTPKLADSSLPGVPHEILLASRPSGPDKPIANTELPSSSTPDPRNVQKLDSIIENLGNAKPSVVRTGPPGRTDVVDGPGPDGDPGPGIAGLPDGSGRGFSLGVGTLDPPRPPDPQKPQPKQVDTAKPVRLTSTVLQGKAIHRVVPVYPALARQIRLTGEVSVEVMISPEGRVESVRVVSGHPMFVQTALDAARAWRFDSTTLNGVPVRVTGVITFVFKLND